MQKIFQEFEQAWQRASELNEQNPFGVPIWMGYRNGSTLHFDGEKFLIACQTRPCVEITRTHMIVFAPSSQWKWSTHTYAWNQILRHLVRKIVKKGVGFSSKHIPLIDKRCYFLRINGQTYPFYDFLVLNENFEVVNSDMASTEVVTDTEKTKAFNKKLRMLFKPYEVAVRLGLYDQILKEKKPNRSLDSYERLETYIAENKEDNKQVIEDNYAWLTSVLRSDFCYRPQRIFPMTFLTHINTAKRKLRLLFAQKCTRLKHQKYLGAAAYVNYQNMVLQQADGLRTVPLSGEVKVRRPRARTPQTTPSGKD